MIRHLVAYAATGIVFAVADFLWLSWAAPRLYRPAIGELLADTVRLPSAILFYVIYIAGLVLFAVAPALEAGRWTKAALLGAAAGLFAYATYDLTAQATMKVWSVKLTLADLAWGMAVSALAATAGYRAARMLG